jgi:peptide deformylase
MSTLPILQDGAPLLRNICLPVPPALFGTPELAAMVRDMADTLDGEADGVAIAAPQIGISYRIFLVRYDRMAPPSEEGEPPRPADIGVYINPELVRLSKKSEVMDEGCLSVRHRYGKTERKSQATIRAVDTAGHAFTRGAGGILAQAFQHEVDHLNGILFIDHATEVIEIAPEEIEKSREERRKRREESGAYDIDSE